MRLAHVKKTEIKYCRRCSRKITVILFRFYLLCEPLYTLYNDRQYTYYKGDVYICYDAVDNPYMGGLAPAGTELRVWSILY